MELVFWVTVLIIIYPHLIFPSLLYIFPSNKVENLGKGAVGPVAVVCSVYNEEKVIANKIENFYKIDYPELDLYLGLDGCTDNTIAEIRRVVRDDRVKVFAFPRGGKVNVINALLANVHHPYIVMTDANSMFRPDAIARLMENMKPGVGVVCGRLVLLDEKEESGEGIYWRIETFVKTAESDYGSVIGANGAIYLFRRELFEQLPPNTINDDFTVSMSIYESGHSVVYAADAVAEEKLVTTDREEFRRHVRDGAGHFRAMRSLLPLLNPLKGKRFFFYFSHRVLRWITPFFLILLFVLNTILAQGKPFYQALLAGQCVAYTLMAVVHFLGIRWRPIYVPYYFLLLNLAIFVGCIKNILGIQKTVWESTKR